MTPERVRDQGASESAVERRAAELVQSFHLVDPSSLPKQRILSAIRSARSRRGSRTLSLVFAVLALLVATGAVAGFAFRHRLTHARDLESAPAPTTVAGPSSQGTDEAAQEKPTTPDDLSPESQPIAPSVDPGRSSKAPSSNSSAQRMASSEESVFVVDAMTALRREHDPAKAMGLLDRYLAAYPRGALREEALALAIEATSATHDARAPQFARQYLQKYPTGRFAESARRIADRSKP